jgi:hypothetical protein
MRRIYRPGTCVDRLRAAGFLEKRDMARLLKISVGTLKTWYRHGFITGNVSDLDQHTVVLDLPIDARPPIRMLDHEMVADTPDYTGRTN